jgi:hypothetical protein
MSVAINGTTGLVFADGTSQATGASGFGFKNRIINGAMMIDQRNAGASVNGTSGVYTLDRWDVQNNSGASRFTVQQNAGSVTPPNGFSNYLGITSTGAYSVASTDVISIRQKIEGYSSADFSWGTSSASSVVLSFWVRSSLTGTFGGSVKSGTSSYSFPFSYTISAANTWEQKSIVISGATAGSWNTTNGNAIELYFNMGTGSSYNGTAGSWAAADYRSATGATSVVGTNGATFYITGVQLEKGSTATSFDYRPYGMELQLCERYYEVVESGEIPEAGNYYSSWRYINPLRFRVVKRAIPTIEKITQSGYPNGAGGSYGVAAATQNVAFIGQSGAAQTNTLHYYNFSANAEL